MTTIFHVSPEGPGKCGATKGKCPYGGRSGLDNHYTSFEAAELAFSKAFETEPLRKKNTAREQWRALGRPYEEAYYFTLKPHRSGVSSWPTMDNELITAFSKREWEEDTLYPRTRKADLAWGENRIERAQMEELIDRLERNLKTYGVRALKNPQEEAQAKLLEAELEAAKKELDKIKRYPDSPGTQYKSDKTRQILISSAARLASHRVLDGIRVKPGQALGRGLYKTDGTLVGLVRFSQQPKREFKALDNDGNETVFTMPNGTPEKRFQKLKEQGYILAPVVIPVTLGVSPIDETKPKVSTVSKKKLQGSIERVKDPNAFAGAQSWPNTVGTSNVVW